jgi:hypothetical protein
MLEFVQVTGPTSAVDRHFPADPASFRWISEIVAGVS